MRWHGTQSKLLREGGLLIGSEWCATSATSEPTVGTWICGSEAAVQQLAGEINDAFYQIIDAGGQRMLFQVEQEEGPWLAMIVDLDDDLGQLAIDARRPFRVLPMRAIAQLQLEIGPDKTLPLPPDLEDYLAKALRSCKHRFQQFRDGTFKLSRIA